MLIIIYFRSYKMFVFVYTESLENISHMLNVCHVTAITDLNFNHFTYSFLVTLLLMLSKFYTFNTLHKKKVVQQLANWSALISHTSLCILTSICLCIVSLWRRICWLIDEWWRFLVLPFTSLLNWRREFVHVDEME